MKTVAIIGASGFIGSFITKKFLQEGYKVRVSATEMTKMDKHNHFDDLPEMRNLEIVPLIVQGNKSLKKFLSNSQVAVHGGTPFLVDIKQTRLETDQVKTMDSNKFLDAIGELGHIERVIMVGSVAPFDTNYSMPWDDAGFAFNLNDKNSLFVSEESDGYKGAKFQPNEAIQNFADANSEIGFKLFSIAPFLDNSSQTNEDEDIQILNFLIKQHPVLEYSKLTK